MDLPLLPRGDLGIRLHGRSRKPIDAPNMSSSLVQVGWAVAQSGGETEPRGETAAVPSQTRVCAPQCCASGPAASASRRSSDGSLWVPGAVHGPATWPRAMEPSGRRFVYFCAENHE